MSIGYNNPGPAFDGPDAGEVTSRAARAIERARKTKIGLMANLAPVWRLDEGIEWIDTIGDYNQYGAWVGTKDIRRSLSAGAVVTSDGEAPTQAWAELGTSVEHNVVVMYDNDPWCTRKGCAKEIKAAIAARWVIENIPNPDRDAWYDLVSRVAVGDTRGMAGGKGSARDAAWDALRQYEAGETDAARTAREQEEKARAEEARRLAQSPFAALKGLVI